MEAAEYFRAAGEHASALYANTEALAHLETALALGHPDVAALNEAIGDVRTLLGDYGAALASYEAAAAQSGPERLAALEHKLGQLHHRSGNWVLAENRFRAALAAAGDDDGARRARIVADRSLTAHRRGEEQEAHALASEALSLAEEAGDERALAQSRNLLGILTKSRGELEAARMHLEESLAFAKRLGEPGARVAALNNLALTAREEGDMERAEELTKAALELCAAQGDRHREGRSTTTSPTFSAPPAGTAKRCRI